MPTKPMPNRAFTIYSAIIHNVTIYTTISKPIRISNHFYCKPVQCAGLTFLVSLVKICSLILSFLFTCSFLFNNHLHSVVSSLLLILFMLHILCILSSCLCYYWLQIILSFSVPSIGYTATVLDCVDPASGCIIVHPNFVPFSCTCFCCWYHCLWYWSLLCLCFYATLSLFSFSDKYVPFHYLSKQNTLSLSL